MLKLEKEVGNGGNISASVNIPYNGAITITKKNSGASQIFIFHRVDWEPLKKAIDAMLAMAEADKE